MLERSQHNVRFSVLAALVTMSIAFYIAMDSIFLRAFPGQRAVYASVVLISLAALLYALPNVRISFREMMLAFGWLLANSVWLALSIWHPHIYPQWISGDLVSMMLPLVLFLVASRYPQLFTSRRMLHIFGLLLLVAAVLGAIIGIGPNNRFESPATLLFPLVWLGFATAHGPKKTVWAAALGVLAILAVGAGERTAMVIWIASGLAVYSLFWPARRIIVAGVLVVILATVFGAAIFQAGLRDALEQTRFRQNLEGAADASLITRINEAQDVMLAFGEADVVRKVVGHGHGASLRPAHSLTLQTLSADGLMHHVHIGPALVLYRYGIIGVLVLGWLWLLVVASLLRYRGMNSRDWNYVEVAFSLAILMYLVDFLLRNVIADPAFSYVAAGFLYLQSRRQRRVGESTNAPAAIPHV